MRKVKKNILGRRVLLIAMAILAWNCQKEETTIPQEETAQTGRAVHMTTLQQLPSHIREQVSLSSGAVQGKSPWGKGGEPFGEVVEDRVDVLETPDGTTSYTLGMEKLADGAYMDNLVVTEDMDGALDTHILRYRPSDGWLAERASGDVGWGVYSGEIAIFDGEGNPIAAGVFSNGQVTGQATGKGTVGKNDVMDCVVTNVSYGGLEQDGEFHVTDIIIDYECSGGGGDGLELGPDLPNGGGQLPQGGGQPQGGGGGGPQGGGGQVPTLVDDRLVFNEEEMLEELAPDTPIEDIEEFLSCYDTSQSATFTIYANQPVNNYSSSYTPFGEDKVGHAFVSISQNGKTSTFGFYPDGEGLKDAYRGPSKMGDNGGDPYDVSLSKSISGIVLAQILNKAKQYPDTYDLYNYNCTDYALELANLAGFNIDNAWGTYPGGSGGDNPGKLGQILRTRLGANTSGGNAPQKNNGCN